MCNLYSMTTNVEAMRRLFGRFIGDHDNIPPFLEIYPGYAAPILRGPSAAMKLDLAPWGVEFPREPGKRITNVRNLDSPFWMPCLRTPAYRCLVPVSAFCEWTGEPGRKRKVWFALKSGEPFAFAGIMREGADGPNMAFLTCAPNSLVGQYHPKAMPVMLKPEDHAVWLDGSHAQAVALARPFPADAMEITEPPRN